MKYKTALICFALSAMTVLPGASAFAGGPLDVIIDYCQVSCNTEWKANIDKCKNSCAPNSTCYTQCYNIAAAKDEKCIAGCDTWNSGVSVPLPGPVQR